MVNAHLLPTLGALRLQKLRHAHISALYEDLLNRHDGRKLSAKSVRNIHMILRKALADACDWGHLTGNPADRVPLPRAPRANQHAANNTTWSAGQVKQFLEHVCDDDQQALWTLAATTGCADPSFSGCAGET